MDTAGYNCLNVEYHYRVQDATSAMSQGTVLTW